jgi:hypothetical protein
VTSRQSNKPTSTEDSGGDQLSIVLWERIGALEDRYASLADEIEMGDDTVRRTRLRLARNYIDACRELMVEEAE